MSEEEQREFEDNVKTLSLQLRLLTPQLAEHAKKLEEGTKKMHALELSLKELKCGEHKITIDNIDKKTDEHISAGNKWRAAIVGAFVTIILVIIGTAVTWGVTQEKISQLERVTYERHVETNQRLAP